MARPVAIRPDVRELPDRRVAIDYGPPGPFVTLTPRQVRGLVYALAAAGWVTADGKQLRPPL